MMICRHCQDSVRIQGLQVVADSDDTVSCHAAPLVTCPHCRGEGCGSCEHYGEVYGRHAVAR